MELLPPETDEELLWWLQEEEDEAEQMQWEKVAATLVVVREATGLLMRAKWRAWRDPPRWLGQAGCPWLWQSSHWWWWQLSYPTHAHHPSLPPCPLQCLWPVLCRARILLQLSHPWPPQQRPAPYQAILAREPPERPEVPKLRWPRAGGEVGEGGVVGSLPGP